MKTCDTELSISLTSREKLGFDWEVRCQHVLTDLGIKHKGNPTDPVTWKRKGCGNNKPKQQRPDIETELFQFECKCARYKAYPCHLRKNVDPRFKDDARKKVVLANDKNLWTDETKEQLATRNMLLWDDNDLKNYYKTPSFISIYNAFRKTSMTSISIIEYTTTISHTKTTRTASELISIWRGVEQNRQTTRLFPPKKNDTINAKNQTTTLLGKIIAIFKNRWNTMVSSLNKRPKQNMMPRASEIPNNSSQQQPPTTDAKTRSEIQALTKSSIMPSQRLTPLGPCLGSLSQERGDTYYRFLPCP